ncbi:MAG: hypothetical protein F4X26_05655 [Chloroflexi bacterium]|nr:hypothetical protein [Chloroflexota bacterium]MYD65451.1 hypothetical protein [Chloroflexota bacterium]
MLDETAHRQVPGVEELRRDDAATVAARRDVVQAHGNESHWWNHASFMLPLIGFLAFTVPGLLFGWAEATGFGIFLGVVLLLQLPVVWFTWRGTATAIVLTETGALALHRGEVRREVRWSDLESIERVETFGNVRWKLVDRDGEHISIEGEIADIPALVERASELSGVKPGGP